MIEVQDCFYLELFAHSELFFTYFLLFSLESLFINFCDLTQPSSRIVIQSYMTWDYFWCNYFKARNIVNLMRNAFGSSILNVFLGDQCIYYKYNYKDILPNLS